MKLNRVLLIFLATRQYRYKNKTLALFIRKIVDPVEYYREKKNVENPQRFSKSARKATKKKEKESEARESQSRRVKPP